MHEITTYLSPEFLAALFLGYSIFMIIFVATLWEISHFRDLQEEILKELKALNKIFEPFKKYK